MARARKDIPKGKEGTETLAVVEEHPITRTLEENYMPYSMSVIISRAIPEIDGFKPAHRKLLYMMYKNGLLNGQRKKSATIVGDTMKLNPHGDASIYETMVRLTSGNEALLHPFIDSKGSFGKQYSKMAYAAARYTEAKLEPICAEIFGGIDKDAVDFKDNYDGTMKEPVLLPTSFPNVLVSANKGIAVGLASDICSFNLAEVCDAAIAVIRDGIGTPLTDILIAPDFSTGGLLLYDKEELENIYKTGKGSFRLRAKYNYEKSGNIIEITEIPYTTYTEVIIDRLAELIKAGRLKEISDVRDETDLNGLKIAIDLKRGTDPDKLMKRLYKLTTLEDTFKCNFNILIAGTPHLLGVAEILDEWHAYRCECLSRELFYELRKKEEKLHLLKGLEKILLDIDKAIAIIRSTKNDRDVVPNLAAGFDIDETQAEYIADIKLRNLNKEYILRQTAEIEKLMKEIADIEGILKSKRRMDNLIIKQLEKIKEKYGKPRKTALITEGDIIESEEETEEIPDTPVYAVMSREGYFKKILPSSLRMNDTQKFKDGDVQVFFEQLSERTELLFFTSSAQCYKSSMSEFENTKASALGDFVGTKLEFEAGEKFTFMAATNDYTEKLFILFENGKSVMIPLEAYKTKTHRKKLTGAVSSASPVVSAFVIKDKCDIFIKTKAGRGLLIPSELVPEFQSRSSGGSQTIALRKGDVPIYAEACEQGAYPDMVRKRKIPSPGEIL